MNRKSDTVWVRVIFFILFIFFAGIGYAQEAVSSAAKNEDKAIASEYAGMQTCVLCHKKESEAFSKTTHSRIVLPGDVKDTGCETCHGPGKLHVTKASAGEDVSHVGHIVNPRKNSEACFVCHVDKKVEFRLQYHHPVLEGKMSCTDCHAVHAPEVRPWSATSLDDINEVCFKCHEERRGPFVWEHEALREGCPTCHKVHGSINDKMLIRRDANLCLVCHTQTNFPTIGRTSHATNLTQGACFSNGCHTAVHGSNFDDHLRY